MEHKKTIYVEEDLPWFQGHFPNNPILPGFVALQWAIDWVQETHPTSKIKVENAKFLDPIRPNDIIEANMIQEDSRYKVLLKSQKTQKKFNCFFQLDTHSYS